MIRCVVTQVVVQAGTILEKPRNQDEVVRHDGRDFMSLDYMVT